MMASGEAEANVGRATRVGRHGAGSERQDRSGGTMAEDPEKEKEELIRLLEDAGPGAKQMESMGQAMVESARFVQDMAKPLVEVYKQIPADQMPSGEWARQSKGWRAWHGMVNTIHGMQPNVNSFSAMTMSSANSAVSGAVMWFGPFPPATPPPPAAEAAMTTIYQTLERFPLVDKAIASMRRLGLDRRGGYSRPALDLVERSERGDGTPGCRGWRSSLNTDFGFANASVPRSRNCRAAPEQEEAKRWGGKVISVGSHCGRPSLPSDHFNRLGVDCGNADGRTLRCQTVWHGSRPS